MFLKLFWYSTEIIGVLDSMLIVLHITHKNRSILHRIWKFWHFKWGIMLICRSKIFTKLEILKNLHTTIFLKFWYVVATCMHNIPSIVSLGVTRHFFKISPTSYLVIQLKWSDHYRGLFWHSNQTLVLDVEWPISLPVCWLTNQHPVPDFLPDHQNKPQAQETWPTVSVASPYI